jgi:hypothetical protein
MRLADTAGLFVALSGRLDMCVHTSLRREGVMAEVPPPVQLPEAKERPAPLAVRF